MTKKTPKKPTKDKDADVYENLEKKFKKRGLGRGLDALFQDEEGEYPQLDEDGKVFEKPESNLDVSPEVAARQRRLIGTAQIHPGVYQPRKKFIDSSLEELAESIKQHGVIQPLLVRPHPHSSDKFEIVAGERRWRAAQIAGIHEVPVIIKDLSDKLTLEIGLIENLQREDLNPIDEASALAQLIEEFEYTQEAAAKSVGKSRSYVANMTRLMKLPAKIQSYLRDGELSAGHARALITSDDPEMLAEEIIKGGLNVREVEGLMSKKKGKKPSSKKEKPVKDINTLALENEISDQLGLRVSIDMKNKAAGKVSIEFKSLDQLDEIIHRLSKVS
ncbi:MAG: ParB/RepB/Spo0J family partition protein [Alphaproteobacteria bacterium]|nr:ParB/RepB/Spo0J family partition protein [Alphaproteobacteria bacterium]